MHGGDRSHISTKSRIAYTVGSISISARRRGDKAIGCEPQLSQGNHSYREISKNCPMVCRGHNMNAEVTAGQNL